MENINEKEVDNVVRPEYCRRGHQSGVDNVDGDEEPDDGEERPGHQVVGVLLERDQVPPEPAQGQESREKTKTQGSGTRIRIRIFLYLPKVVIC